MKHQIGLLLIFCIIIFSCSHKKETLPNELSKAESIMWEHPDSALSLLCSMPQSSLPGKKFYATWCLLVAQARDKAYGKHLPDSLNIPSSEELVQNALTYFEGGNDLKRKAQAYFYKGQLVGDKKEYTEAIPYYLKAKDIMEGLDEPLFSYLICQTLGNIYRYQNLYEESLVHLRHSYQYALESKNGERVSYALSEIGRTYAVCGQLDSALYYFGESLYNSQKIGNIELQGMAMGELGVIYGELEEYDKALSYAREELEMYLKFSLLSSLPQAQYGLGCAFWWSNQLDSAILYLKQSLNSTNIYTVEAANNVLYQISKERSNYKEAIEYNEQYLIYSDSIQQITLTKELSEIQARYDHEKLLNLNYQLRINKSQQKMIGLVLILILLGLVVIFQYRLMKRTKSLQKAKEMILFCETQLSINEEQILKNDELIASLSQDTEKMAELRLRNEDLCRKNEDLNTEIRENILLMKSQHAALSDFLPYFDKLKRLKARPRYLEEKDWKVVIEWVNLLYNHVYIRMETDFPDLTEVEKQYCCLIKMGFTNTEISVFMGVAPTSVTKQKQRIKLRINKNIPFLIDRYVPLDQYLKSY